MSTDNLKKVIISWLIWKSLDETHIHWMTCQVQDKNRFWLLGYQDTDIHYIIQLQVTQDNYRKNNSKIHVKGSTYLMIYIGITFNKLGCLP